MRAPFATTPLKREVGPGLLLRGDRESLGVATHLVLYVAIGMEHKPTVQKRSKVRLAMLSWERQRRTGLDQRLII